MVEKKRPHCVPGRDPKTPEPSQAGRLPLEPGALDRFLQVLALVFALLALASWGYNVWGVLAVLQPARQQLALQSPQGLKETVRLLETPHLFSGYDPYHGFGSDKAHATYERVKAILAAGQDYSDAQVRYLRHQTAYFLAAFREVKVEQAGPLVPADWQVVEGALTLWENAVRSGLIFSGYLTLVALLLGGLALIYRRKGLSRRI